MIFLKNLSIVVFVFILSACGGGGGSAGKTGSTSGTKVVPVPTITLSIVDANDTAISGNSIGSGTQSYAKAILKDTNGVVVPNKLVTFSVSSAVAILSQTTALTDSNGVAKVQISPSNVTSANAGSLLASAKVNDVGVSADIDFQTTAANVTLSNITAVPSSISALQTTTVKVEARVNGVLAGSSVVSASFSSTCGSFSPASGKTSSAGVVSTVYQADSGCSGPVTITAQTPGATAVTTTVNVTPAQAANVLFDSATVPLMVTSSATTGLKQSTLKFRVLDATGAGLSGQVVNISLADAAKSAGVTFSVAAGATTSAQPVPTNSDGYASVIVSAGSLPTPVVVTATLAGNSSISASSSGVAVTSGKATQNAASLSATKLSVEGFGIDGSQTTLTMRVADRQGNPVPAGTAVNFVTSYGLIQGSCLLDSSSQCSVTYTSQGIRPANGRTVILAYMDGEESFIDLNGDNIWQVGETFYDVGTLYRDDDESLSYTNGEQTYPGGAIGTKVCAAGTYSYPSVANTCDGTWSSEIRVRKQITIALATTGADITLTAARTAFGFAVRVADLNGNSMPTGTTVAAEVVTSGAVCTVKSVSPGLVRNTPNAGDHVVSLDGAADCSTVRVNVTVTPPSGSATVVGF